MGSLMDEEVLVINVSERAPPGPGLGVFLWQIPGPGEYSVDYHAPPEGPHEHSTSPGEPEPPS
jgi:hypothetical protein